MHIRIRTTTLINMDIIKLLNMFQVSDSAFPIGSFTMSNGLETFTQKEKLKTAEDLRQYVENYISFMKYNELGILNLICNFNEDNIVLLDNMYSAIRTPHEIRIGSNKLCKRFIKTWSKIEKLPNLQKYQQLIEEGFCVGHHTICIALFIKDKKIDFNTGASAYAYSVVSAIITNAVKNVPLSQLDGGLILNNSFESIENAVNQSKDTTIEKLGIGGTGFEIYSYNHENLYSRLYMS